MQNHTECMQETFNQSIKQSIIFLEWP